MTEEAARWIARTVPCFIRPTPPAIPVSPHTETQSTSSGLFGVTNTKF